MTEASTSSTFSQAFLRSWTPFRTYRSSSQARPHRRCSLLPDSQKRSASDLSTRAAPHASLRWSRFDFASKGPTVSCNCSFFAMGDLPTPQKVARNLPTPPVSTRVASRLSPGGDAMGSRTADHREDGFPGRCHGSDTSRMARYSPGASATWSFTRVSQATEQPPPRRRQRERGLSLAAGAALAAAQRPRERRV